jgi:hypothetical protein
MRPYDRSAGHCDSPKVNVATSRIVVGARNAGDVDTDDVDEKP